MKANVFTDESLRSEAGRFVWLAIDTEKPENAELLEKYPLRALPTYFIIEPDSERIAVRFVGGASAAALKKILDDGSDRVHAAWKDPSILMADASDLKEKRNVPPASGSGSDEMNQLLDDLMSRADRLYAAEEDSAAGASYVAAIQLAPENWPSYGRAVESALFSLSNVEDYTTISQVCEEAWPRLIKTSSAGSVATSGLDAAVHLPKETPNRAGLIGKYEVACRKVLTDPEIAATPDDRSGIYMTMIDAKETVGDSVAARGVTGEWSAYLDKAAKEAKTPAARTVMDSHRLSAYIELGTPEKAIPMLEQSQRDFPDDYNPPARLAIAWRAMKQYDKALAANSRALERVYGPRTIVVLNVRTGIYKEMKDYANARATIEKAIATAENLPEGQRSQRTIDSLNKQLAALPNP